MNNVSRRRRRKQPGERLTVYLPPSLLRELRHRCIEEDRSVSDAITTLVSAWMSGASK